MATQLSLDTAPRRKEETEAADSFDKLWTWANDPDPAYYIEAAADMRKLWNKYAATQRRLKALEAETAIAANRRTASGKLAVGYGDKLREAEFEIARLESKLAAANMPLRLAALLVAATALFIVLAVVL